MSNLRAETAGLARLARRDVSGIFGLVRDGVSASLALNDLLPGLIVSYGSMGAAVAAEWYDEERAAALAAGSFTAEPMEASDRGASALIGWALSTATSDEALLALAVGGTQRRIADHVRLTVAVNAVADPKAHGWRRVGRPECEWCRRHLTGEVHYVTGYDFPAHDGCNCGVEPAW